jgi:hypothetical protein
MRPDADHICPKEENDAIAPVVTKSLTRPGFPAVPAILGYACSPRVPAPTAGAARAPPTVLEYPVSTDGQGFPWFRTRQIPAVLQRGYSGRSLCLIGSAALVAGQPSPALAAAIPCEPRRPARGVGRGPAERRDYAEFRVDSPRRPRRYGRLRHRRGRRLPQDRVDRDHEFPGLAHAAFARDHHVRRGCRDQHLTRYTHHSPLRTIETALGLAALTANDRYDQPLNNIFIRNGPFSPPPSPPSLAAGRPGAAGRLGSQLRPEHRQPGEPRDGPE